MDEKNIEVPIEFPREEGLKQMRKRMRLATSGRFLLNFHEKKD